MEKLFNTVASVRRVSDEVRKEVDPGRTRDAPTAEGKGRPDRNARVRHKTSSLGSRRDGRSRSASPPPSPLLPILAAQEDRPKTFRVIFSLPVKIFFFFLFLLPRNGANVRRFIRLDKCINKYNNILTYFISKDKTYSILVCSVLCTFF